MYSLSSLNMISVKAIKERGSGALNFFLLASHLGGELEFSIK